MAQSGAIDENTTTQIGLSLAENIQDVPQRKIYVISDLNITTNTSKEKVKKYVADIFSVYDKYKSTANVVKILQEFTENGEEASILLKLAPIVSQRTKAITELIKIQTPQSLAFQHLKLINTSQQVLENIYDMQNMENDPIVSFGAIVQYENNIFDLEKATNELSDAINIELNN